MGKFKNAQRFLISILKCLSIFKGWFLKKNLRWVGWLSTVSVFFNSFVLETRTDQAGGAQSFFPPWLWHMYWWWPCILIPETHLELLKIHLSKYIESRFHGEEFKFHKEFKSSWWFWCIGENHSLYNGGTKAGGEEG